MSAFQTGEKLGVRHPLSAAGCIDTDRPKPAKLALFLLPVRRGKPESPLHRFAGSAVEFTPASEKALGPLQPFFAPAPGGPNICNAWHPISLLILFIGKKEVKPLAVGLVHFLPSAKSALLAGLPVRQKVTAFGPGREHFSLCGNLEPFLRCFIGLEFRHFCWSCFRLSCSSLTWGRCTYESPCLPGRRYVRGRPNRPSPR